MWQGYVALYSKFESTGEVSTLKDSRMISKPPQIHFVSPTNTQMAQRWNMKNDTGSVASALAL